MSCTSFQMLRSLFVLMLTFGLLISPLPGHWTSAIWASMDHRARHFSNTLFSSHPCLPSPTPLPTWLTPEAAFSVSPWVILKHQQKPFNSATQAEASGFWWLLWGQGRCLVHFYSHRAWHIEHPPGFLPEDSHGQRSPWGCKESDTTEAT